MFTHQYKLQKKGSTNDKAIWFTMIFTFTSDLQSINTDQYHDM